MAPSDEPEEIVVRVTDDQAIVIGVPSETERPTWGRWMADINQHELASLVRTLDPATRAFIEARRLTGCLVELDPTSRAMWSTFKKVTEGGGWIQANLRTDQGRFARVMRIRPVTGLAAVSGGIAILGAIAAQAQTAEMARNIEAIRQRVDAIYEYLQSGQTGAVEHAVEQVEDLVARLRLHGRDGVKEGDVPIIRDRLGEARHKCMRHLNDAVAKLEDAKQHESSRKAEKSLSTGAVQEVMLHLDLLGKLYAASVQFGLAQVALEFHEGKCDVARTQAQLITASTAKFRAQLKHACGRLGQLDESIRARFGTVHRRAWVPHVSQSLIRGAGLKVITARLPGVPVTIPIPMPKNIVATVGGALLPPVVGGIDAAVQALAEKKLDERLLQLTQASSTITERMDQAAESLEVLRALTEELASPVE
ncbi:hypothetical protein [Streptomyces poonensis]|uniref:hypothetical protein n=1 Tax=Streptomyces poonensis TaxID=68255 RepID=UPI0016725A5C|nr:hypothetical protein [Streptomyces poonensis]